MREGEEVNERCSLTEYSLYPAEETEVWRENVASLHS